MFDFFGWSTSFDWTGLVTGRVPGWLVGSAVLAGATGTVLLVVGFATAGTSAWLPLAGLLVAALVVDGVTVGPMEGRLLALGHGHALALAGVAAFVTRNADPTLAAVAPCVAVASAPLLTRIWCATLFSAGMIRFSEDRNRVAAEALAGSSEVLLVELGAEHEDGFELSICRTEGDIPARAPKSLFAKERWLRPGHGYLLEQPKLREDTREPDGYRGSQRVTWIESSAKLRWFGRDRHGMPPSAYADEVRAGVVVMLGHHALVLAVAYAVARLFF